MPNGVYLDLNYRKWKRQCYRPNIFFYTQAEFIRHFKCTAVFILPPIPLTVWVSETFIARKSLSSPGFEPPLRTSLKSLTVFTSTLSHSATWRKRKVAISSLFKSRKNERTMLGEEFYPAVIYSNKFAKPEK